MKPSEIRDLSKDEQLDKLKSLKEELFNLRFQHATGQLENPMRLREVKKSIARVKTILREGEIRGQVLGVRCQAPGIRYVSHLAIGAQGVITVKDDIAL